jgi:hypothetical protein
MEPMAKQAAMEKLLAMTEDEEAKGFGAKPLITIEISVPSENDGEPDNTGDGSTDGNAAPTNDAMFEDLINKKRG